MHNKVWMRQTQYLSRRFMKHISRNVWLLSLVSLFTDFASEMTIPLLPVYLVSIGFSVGAIGVLEGVAEAISAFGKGYFGALSDSLRKRKVFIVLGYGLSALSKPMLALFSSLPGIYVARSLDRVGKGIRTAPRDALLNDEAAPEHRSAVFGFHRSMDTIGAILGPAAVLLFLAYFSDNIAQVFLWAIVPGLLATVIALIVKEKKHAMESNSRPSYNPLAFIRYFASKAGEYRKICLTLLLFGLVNSADALLILKMQHEGLSIQQIIWAYIGFNVIYALASYPLGRLADSLGPRRVLAAGFLLYAVVYISWGFASGWAQFAVLYLFYGLYYASTEGVSKAWICALVPKAEAGSALGAFQALNSLAVICAGVIAGLLWQYNASWPFIAAGCTALIIIPLLLSIRTAE